MIIGIEAERANNPNKTGVEHYAKQLILHLAKIDTQNSYILYLRTPPEEWFLKLPKNFSVKVMPFPIFWTQLRVSWEMLFHPVDVLFIPASALPIIHPKNSVVTIHDVAWKFYPETFTWFNRNFLEWSTRFAIRNARRIIAVSEATKKDVIRFYNAEPEKIAVVHHGYELEDTSYKTQDTNSDEIPSKYVLFVSTLQPRKNVQGLIEAFQKLKTERPDLPHKLVIVGRPGWKYKSILETIRTAPDVVYIDRLTENKKAVLYKGADVFVLPSFYEGFGMTILEAFAAGAPVATAKVSSMPEVAEGAAAYFDPHSIDDMKNTIKNILLDKSLADSLREKGKERLKAFNWEKSAKQTLEVFLNK